MTALDRTTLVALALSPDGRRLAAVLDDERRRVLVVTDVRKEQPARRVATGRISHPTWHPDGDRVGFVGTPDEDGVADGTPQVWTVALDGTVDRWTDVPTGVQNFDWSPDGDRIVVVAMTAEEQHVGHGRGRQYAVERYPAHVPGTGRVAAVGRALFVVDEDGDVAGIDGTTVDGYGVPATGLAPAWGERRIAFLAEPTDLDVSPDSSVDGGCAPTTLLARDVATVPAPPATGEVERLTDGDVTASAPRWGPSGRRLAFVAGDPTSPHAPTDLWVAEDGELSVLTAELDRRIGTTGGGWLDASRFLVPVADRGRTILAVCPVEGSPERIDAVPDDATVCAVDTAGGTVAVCRSTAADGQSVLLGDTPESVSPATVAEPAGSISGTADYPRPERVRWEAGGETIEGWVFPPEGTPPYPVVTRVHGGPVSFASPGFDTTTNCFRAAGYAVFAPNYRGSVSYGRRFATAGATDWTGEPLTDIDRGVTALVDRGVADPERQFLWGRSHGGTLVAALVAQTDRFAAAAAEHAVFDFHAAFGATDATPRLEQALGTPWESPDRYDRVSPITDADDVSTPLLVATGDADRHAPPRQAEALYARLRRRGVASRLLVYPDTGHGVTDGRVAENRIAELTEWFDRHDTETDR